MPDASPADFWLAFIALNAFKRNVFDHLPVLANFYVSFNVCIDRDFILIDSAETNIVPYMQDCFNNFELQ